MHEVQRRSELPLERDNEMLRGELSEALEVLNAIRGGNVDALVVEGPHGPQVYTLHGADYPYRVFLEGINEGAVTLATDGMVLYANRAFAALLGQSLEQIGGRDFRQFLEPAHLRAVDELLDERSDASARRAVELQSAPGVDPVPVQLSSRRLQTAPGCEWLCLIVTDLREQRLREELARSEARVSADLEAIIVLYEAGSLCVQPAAVLEHCLDRLLEAALLVSRADRCVLQVIDSDTGALAIAAQRGCSTRLLELFGALDASVQTVGRAALARAERVIVPDMQQCMLLSTEAIETMLAEQVRAVVSTPIQGSSGTLLGVVSLCFQRPLQPSQRELRLLDLLARQAADFLERKRAEEELHRSGERLRLATVLHDKLAQALVQTRLKLEQVLREPIDSAHATQLRQADELLAEALSCTRKLG